MKKTEFPPARKNRAGCAEKPRGVRGKTALPSLCSLFLCVRSTHSP
jgi:hypothetical protein